MKEKSEWSVHEGLDLVRSAADAVLVLDNNNLCIMSQISHGRSISIMDQLIAEIVKGVVETITLPSLINLDFADVGVL